MFTADIKTCEHYGTDSIISVFNIRIFKGKILQWDEEIETKEVRV